MMTADYLTCGEEMVRRGQMEEARINEAVRRILTLKEKLGLFDDPFRGRMRKNAASCLRLPPGLRTGRPPSNRWFCSKTAAESCPCGRSRKIAVIGPYAETTALLGGLALHRLGGRGCHSAAGDRAKGR